MAKKKAKAEEPVAEQQPEPVATEPQPTSGKKPGGRQIGTWRKASEAAGGTDEAIAQRVTDWARQAGFADYTFTVDNLLAAQARDRKGSGKGKRKRRAVDTPLFNGQASNTPSIAPTAAEPVKVSAESEGVAVAVLRDLVRLLGKDSTKRLIDGL